MFSWQWPFSQTLSNFSLLPESKLLVLENGQQDGPHQKPPQFFSHGVLMISIGQSIMWECNVKPLWWICLSYLPFAPAHLWLSSICLSGFPQFFSPQYSWLWFSWVRSGVSIPAQTSLQVWLQGSPGHWCVQSEFSLPSLLPACQSFSKGGEETLVHLKDAWAIQLPP